VNTYKRLIIVALALMGLVDEVVAFYSQQQHLFQVFLHVNGNKDGLIVVALDFSMVFVY
jgi:hypothetical protein